MAAIASDGGASKEGVCTALETLWNEVFSDQLVHKLISTTIQYCRDAPDDCLEFYEHVYETVTTWVNDKCDGPVGLKTEELCNMAAEKRPPPLGTRDAALPVSVASHVFCVIRPRWLVPIGRPIGSLRRSMSTSSA